MMQTSRRRVFGLRSKHYRLLYNDHVNLSIELDREDDGR